MAEITNQHPDAAASASWRSLAAPAEIAHAVVELFRTRGSAHYEEAVSQNAHALQCGALALAAGASDSLVAAAFLHDIGHLLLGDDASGEQEPTDHGADERALEDRHHELVGARFLANWFDTSVTAPIALHVPAKRYLCATDPAYAEALSAASVRSLVVQGGPMRADEVARFESVAGADHAVALRRWDDAAKDPDAPTPDLDFFEDLVEAIVARTPARAPRSRAPGAGQGGRGAAPDAVDNRSEVAPR